MPKRNISRGDRPRAWGGGLRALAALLLAAALLAPACARTAYVRDHDLPGPQAQAILERRIWVGMSADELTAAWGEPEDKRDHGRQEKWIYGEDGKPPYVYLEKGRVSGWRK
ncbi:MAG: hypothetical protein KQJ78_11600 [Deltaproteobacteria bacterium]|nr:hypothetical protein [Deltaproteobacteria bacterium]